MNDRGSAGAVISRATRGVCAVWLVLILSACTYNPLREQAPQLDTHSWAELRGQPGYGVSSALASALDERGISATLRLSGQLYYVGTTLDENGAARIESLIRLQRTRKSGKIQRVKHLNQLVYHDKDYRFLKLSVSYWREAADASEPRNAGFYFMRPEQARQARTHNARYQFIRAEPTMSWEAIQPLPADGEDAETATKAERIVERVMIKRQGAVNAYLEANAETRVNFSLQLPVDLVREVVEERSVIAVEMTLSQAFHTSPTTTVPSLTLRGTWAIRNPRLDEGRLIAPQQRTHVGLDRLYSDHLLAEDVAAIADYRRTLLQRLETLLPHADERSARGDEWEATIKKLRPLQRDLGDFIVEATPAELAYLIPAITSIEESVAGELLPQGEATVLAGPNDERLVVKTGDIAIRLGSSRQIAVGTYPLPRVTERDAHGFVTAMEVPGQHNSYAMFRRFFADPQLQPQVQALLGPLWEQVPETIRLAIEQPRDSAEDHPFLSGDPDANKVFFTVLDKFIDAQIENEIAYSQVDDHWETELDREYWPSVINAAEEDALSIEQSNVIAMRGKDGADLRKALAARRNVAAYADLPSPYDLDLSDAAALESQIPYWPGTPILSHVGMVIVENIDGRPRAMVYDAYPGEGIMRKPFSQFFGAEEAAIGAIFRYTGPETTVPALAATEIVKLYALRRNLKRLKVRPVTTGHLPTEVLLANDEAAPPGTRAQAWDSFDYAFDWRNQTRYSCSELVWAHYARRGVNLADSFSMLLAPVVVAQDKLGWGVEVMIQASPQSLVLSDKLQRIVDFDSIEIDETLTRYSETGRTQQLSADKLVKAVGDHNVPTIWFDH